MKGSVLLLVCVLGAVPAFSQDDYPMNKLGEPFGIRWIDGYISDPTDNHDGQPIFHL